MIITLSISWDGLRSHRDQGKRMILVTWQSQPGIERNQSQYQFYIAVCIFLTIIDAAVVIFVHLSQIPVLTVKAGKYLSHRDPETWSQYPVRFMVDLRPIPATLGMKQGSTLDRTKISHMRVKKKAYWSTSSTFLFSQTTSPLRVNPFLQITFTAAPLESHDWANKLSY